MPSVSWWQSPRNHLRQLEGGRTQRLGPRCVSPSRVFGAVRLLLLAADRLDARPGIKGDRRGGRTLREAQRLGRTCRGTDPLRRLPGLAPLWRDQVANVRMHETTRERPVDRFERERSLLRALPAISTTPILSCRQSSILSAIEFDGNRYSAPPEFVRQSRSAPTGTRFACCTRARSSPSTSGATSEGS